MRPPTRTPQCPHHQHGLEEEAYQACRIAVQPERVRAVEVLGHVAGEDSHEEEGQQDAQLRPEPLRQQQARAERDLHDTREDDDQVLVQRYPVRDLGLELHALKGEVANARDQHGQAQADSQQVLNGSPLHERSARLSPPSPSRSSHGIRTGSDGTHFDNSSLVLGGTAL